MGFSPRRARFRGALAAWLALICVGVGGPAIGGPAIGGPAIGGPAIGGPAIGGPAIWGPAVAHAQPPASSPSDAPPPEAIEFYRSGRAHFVAGRYREAIEDLERALQLDPGSPTLLYNLARVNELLGELDQALRYYNAYSALLPTEEREEQERVAETIARLEGAQAHEQVRTAPPETPPTDFELSQPVVTHVRGVADLPFWLTAGGAALALVAGAVLGIVTLQQRASLDDVIVGNPDQCIARDECADSWDARADTVRNLALTTDVTLAVGAVAGITAALLYLLRTREVVTYPEYGGHSRAQPVLDLSPDRALVGVRGTL